MTTLYNSNKSSADNSHDILIHFLCNSRKLSYKYSSLAVFSSAIQLNSDLAKCKIMGFTWDDSQYGGFTI